MVRRLFTDLRRLIEAWWKIDRIRASPREGRLLRIEPPCVVVIDDQPAEVVARTLGRAADESGTIQVDYDCRSAQGACRLRLTVTACGAIAAIAWTAEGIEQLVNEEQVEVYQSFSPREKDFA
jgi:hypothetical protein